MNGNAANPQRGPDLQEPQFDSGSLKHRPLASTIGVAIFKREGYLNGKVGKGKSQIILNIFALVTVRLTTLFVSLSSLKMP